MNSKPLSVAELDDREEKQQRIREQIIAVNYNGHPIMILV